jgi:two-component system, NarL family, sensor kinase
MAVCMACGDGARRFRGSPPPLLSLPPESGLRGLETNMLRLCFRLAAAERRLARRAKRERAGGGARAIRQIELERQRLGRELHTGVGQLLASIRLQLEAVALQLPDPPEGVRNTLDKIGQLAGDALSQVRSVSHRLHPPEWQRLSLDEALRQLWEISGIPGRYEASLEAPPLPREPELEVKSLFYRAAQEALANLVRHARATRVQAALEARGERLALTISDDGVGFDVAAFLKAPPTLRAGIGLRSILQQAAGLGGEFHIESGPKGTRLELSAPFIPIES